MSESRDFEVEFSWTLTVEADTAEEAKEIAPNVILDHLRRVNFDKTDFRVLDRE